MPTHCAVLPRPLAGFAPGFTSVTSTNKKGVFAGDIEFSVYKPAEVGTFAEKSPKETVWVLLHGSAEISYAGTQATVHRASLFDEPPTALHLGPGTPVTMRALAADTEWAVARVENSTTFPPRLYRPAELAPEYRGAGLVQNACLRNVRLIFDYTTRPEANLVIGEVINYPGRWSSYPPHHHVQPEIYHYRFTAPAGYGHAELGDEIVKVRDGDTVLIPPDLDHAQVSAPGYGMYYLWIIRHLPGHPYTGFTFTEEHKWTLDPAQQGWLPPEIPRKSP